MRNICIAKYVNDLQRNQLINACVGVFIESQIEEICYTLILDDVIPRGALAEM